MLQEVRRVLAQANCKNDTNGAACDDRRCVATAKADFYFHPDTSQPVGTQINLFDAYYVASSSHPNVRSREYGSPAAIQSVNVEVFSFGIMAVRFDFKRPEFLPRRFELLSFPRKIDVIVHPSSVGRFGPNHIGISTVHSSARHVRVAAPSPKALSAEISSIVDRILDHFLGNGPVIFISSPYDRYLFELPKKWHIS